MVLLLEQGAVDHEPAAGDLAVFHGDTLRAGTGRTGTVLVSYMSMAVWSLPNAAMIVELVRICMNGAMTAR